MYECTLKCIVVYKTGLGPCRPTIVGFFGRGEGLGAWFILEHVRFLSIIPALHTLTYINITLDVCARSRLMSTIITCSRQRTAIAMGFVVRLCHAVAKRPFRLEMSQLPQ